MTGSGLRLRVSSRKSDPRSTGALVVGVAVATVIAVLDWVFGGAAVLIGLLVVAPLIVAALAGSRETGFTSAYAVALALVLGQRDGMFLTADHLVRMLVVAVGASLAVWIAWLRARSAAAETELRQAVEEVQVVLQGISSAVTVQDPTGRLVYANEAAARLTGFRSTQELLDSAPTEIMRAFEVFDEEGRPVPVESLPGRRALAGEEPEEAVLRFRTLGVERDRWSVVRATPVRNEAGDVALAINIFDDITKQKRGELAERFLSESSRALGSSIDFEATLDNIAHLAVPEFADWCAVDLVGPAGSLQPVAVAHVDPSKVETVEKLRKRYPPDPDSPRGAPHVVRTGETQFIEEVTDEMLAEAAEDNVHLEMIRSLGLRSAIIAPMTAAGRVIGAITFCTAESNQLFDRQDLEVAKDLARRAGTAVENARLYSERAHIARTLQRSLLPPVLPDIPGMEVAARFRPAGEGYEVGGDFYDVFNTGAGGWAVVIGDVCGKGPEAAALTGLARHTLRAAAMQETDPSRVLGLLSEAIRQQSADSQFCTAAFARLELRPVGASLTIASGGHPLPFLVTEDGSVTRIGEPGTLLGAVSNGRLTDHGLDLAPGASLVFYTDGVIEAGRPRGSLGELGLASLLETCAGLDAQEVAERIDRTVVGIEGNPADDVAILVLRVRE
jgi:PAS domain S-box-containing protein